MPFLRAALLKNKARHKQEEEISSLTSVIVAADEPEPERLPDIDNLLKVMDEKAEPEEEANENETAELDEGNSDDTAEPEVVSGDTEDIHVPESDSDGDTVSEIQEEEPKTEEEIEPEVEIESEPEQEQKQQIEAEPQTEIGPEPVPEEEQEQQTETEQEEPEVETVEEEPDPEDETQTESEPEEFKLKYDFTSGERYVDSVSTKTEFDRMLDELSAISGDLLSHEVEKFAVKFTGKFQGDFDKAESDAKKYEAFLGGYITNAAMILYDNGYRDTAIRRLEQAKSILEARKKLEDETAAIKTRVEEDNDSVDLSDILGLFGD